MGVPVRPRLAVQKIARTSGDFFDLRLDDLRFTIYLRLGFMYDFGLRETSWKPRENFELSVESSYLGKAVG